MAYSFYRSITIDHTKCGATDSTNWTLLISGTYSYLATVANGGLVQNGSGFDIAFFSDSGLTSALSWEMPGYVAASGLVEIWVKISTLSHTVDTVIYMAYGNASISTFQGGAVGTAWDSSSRIYHFTDGSTLSGADSSSQAPLNTSSALTNHAATAVAGQIDGGVGTDSGKYMHDDAARGGSPTGYPGPPLTFSMWVKSSSGSNAPFATFGADTGSNQCAIYLFATSSGHGLFFQGGTTTVQTTSVVNDGNWHYLVGVADNAGSANNTHIYFDGALETTGTVTWSISILSATDQLTVGRLGGGAQPLTGSIDEIHIISTNRGADWILAEYNNQKTPATFYAIGNQIGGSGSAFFDPGTVQLGNLGSIIVR